MNKYIDFNLKELINQIGEIHDELKRRDVIRTNNVLGEIGEYLVKEKYRELGYDMVLESTSKQHYDARVGTVKYAIKSVTSKSTGVVRIEGIDTVEKLEKSEKKFDYFVICELGRTYNLKNIYELSWDCFVKYASYHKTSHGFQITLSDKIRKDLGCFIKK